jgi:hypothetical protein
MLSLSELGDLHRRLGDWLDAAESAPTREAPDDSAVLTVRRFLALITGERRERQSDERRSR